ncbi:MAG: hypothetical protein RIS64_4246 [Bacteroidota bacterium]|jgi:copper chaperone CopZ
MIRPYQLTGLTCDNCVTKIKLLLSQVADIQSIEINEQRMEAAITMGKPIPIQAFKNALKAYPKYGIEEKFKLIKTNEFETEEKSWLATYKPLLLLFAYVTGIAFWTAWQQNGFNGMALMRFFMAGFFLSFSFFKLLDLAGFADSYSNYDLLAKRWYHYGFIYPFLELGLGVAYLIDFQPFVTNIVTLMVMGFSSIGVLQSVLNKQTIQCACLGAVFKLPMSTITVLEDVLMMVMALVMLYFMV